MAAWLLQPAVAQVSSEAVPQELRIIEDLPEAVEQGRDVLERGGSRLEDAGNDEPPEETTSRTEGGDDSLLNDDQSLFASPEETPAERLLPDRDDVPEIGLDPRGPDEDRDDPPAGIESDTLATENGLPEDGPAAADTLAEPIDPSGPDAAGGGTSGSGTAGSGGGGSGSLF
ncbi:MAG TPA: hypothetical protein VHG92_05655 [Afifellaceae bacterium]|nr:hypothetical protein [Afifellaceae bacterium]